MGAVQVTHHVGEVADVPCGGVEFGADGPDFLEFGRIGLGEMPGVRRDPADDAAGIRRWQAFEKGCRGGGTAGRRHGWRRSAEAYVNDLDAPRALIAVSAAPNHSKADQDPSTLLPRSAGYACQCATAWVADRPATSWLPTPPRSAKR
ncbi:hypothetical protein [Streptomyces mirabilis]|uniref:hypothetical protein n=1 Tax=Streptomyces mirabilis TaxID=68239 RepID=UPI003320050A